MLIEKIKIKDLNKIVEYLENQKNKTRYSLIFIEANNQEMVEDIIENIRILSLRHSENVFILEKDEIENNYMKINDEIEINPKDLIYPSFYSFKIGIEEPEYYLPGYIKRKELKNIISKMN